MEFMIGCNYWASNAGTEMWRQFDPDAIRSDLEILRDHGVKYMRVFPIWRDFQPVMPKLAGGARVMDYWLEGERESENPYYLDETMMERFDIFLDLCEEYGMKLIVGLITGWMSGRTFIPSILYNKSVLCDTTSQFFAQLFIRGFVSRFKDRSCIHSWDLGNECNALGGGSRVDNANWTGLIAGIIKAADPVRPVVSGMHGLEIENNWTIQDQALFTDILTTHPYAYWCNHTSIDPNLSFRTSLHPTAQTKFYAEIGGKPCLAEEFGTMGPMVCGDESAIYQMRVNLFSLWANESLGMLWWCANDQDLLETHPYTENMCEVELGLIRSNREPKDCMKEMKKFDAFLKSLDFTLPKPQSDAVCLLTREQRHWGVGYMTYLLLKKIGLNCRFAYAVNKLPDAKLYLMPSVENIHVMPKRNYDELKRRVAEGADLYISLNSGHLSGFEQLVGLKPVDSYIHKENHTMQLEMEDGSVEEIGFIRESAKIMDPSVATVLAYDDTGHPVLSVNKYGKGRVFFLNFPLEDNLIEERDAFSGNKHQIYQKLFREYVEAYPVQVSGENVVMTWHPEGNGGYVIAINHSAEDKDPGFKIADGYEVEKVIYGEQSVIGKYDAVILKLIKK